MSGVSVWPPGTDYRLEFGDPSENYSTSSSEACEPRAVAVINGIPVRITGFSIECNTHGASDSATITTSIAGNPDWSLELQAALADGSVIAEIWAGFPANPGPDPVIDGLSRRFLGIVQSMKPAFDSDTVELHLQSLAALLTAEKISTQFGQAGSLSGPYQGTSGYTTVQFVQYVAQLFNLQTNIQVLGNPAKMTAVYAARQWAGVRNVRIMDLLIACAELDNVDVFVDTNGVLNYLAPTDVGRTVIALFWGQHFKTCSGEHSPQFSKTIQVSVRSYTRKTRTAVSTRLRVNADGTLTIKQSSRVTTTQQLFGAPAQITTSTTYNADGSFSSTVSSGSSTGGTANSGYSKFQGETGIETYKFAFPNLTLAQCNAKAIQLWAQISRFEYGLDFAFAVTPERLPDLSITTLFQVSNLPWSAFNNKTADGTQELNLVPPASWSIAQLIKTIADSRYYYQRRYLESFTVDEGWVIAFTCVNHPLPQSGANSLGGAA